MRKIVLPLILLLFSCSKSISTADVLDPDFDMSFSQTTKTVVSSNDAFYDSNSGQWIIPQENPYRLENVQNAYNRLSSGTSKTMVPDSLRSGLLKGKHLNPTHFAVKLFPKNLEEQRELERDERIMVGYIPFGYTSVPTVFLNEKSDIFFDCVAEDSDEVMEATIPAYNPVVLYASWPVEIPFPELVEYEICQELYIPKYYADINEYSEVDFLLEQESMFLAGLENKVETKADEGHPSIYPDGRDGRQGYLKVYDPLLEQYVPLSNVEVRIGVSGVPMLASHTDTDGFFAFSITAPMFYSVNFILQTDYWTICLSPSTVAYTITPGTVQDIWQNSLNTLAIIELDYSNITTIQRAADYFYQQGHLISPYWSMKDDLEINYFNSSSSNYGEFYPSYYYINIYNHGNNCTQVMSTAMHEIGHSVQRYERGTLSSYKSAPKLLRESFGSFMGWYYCRKYYLDHGFIEPYPTYMINHNARQFWSSQSSSIYSPLFVDMVDGFNQSLYYSGTPNDCFENAPLTYIKTMADNCNDIDSIKGIVNSQLSSFSATLSESNDYFDNFYQWIATFGLTY